ncbi:MAG: hypothetical protein WAJ92_06000 [Candidatus Acidiferrales bacterium]
MTERQKSLERALEEAVSRALRDNLAPLQRTADELHQAYADLVAACSSSRPSNALPAMLRAQTAASALAAGLSVLSNFVAVALNPRDQHASEEAARAATAVAAPEEATEDVNRAEPEEIAREAQPAPQPASEKQHHPAAPKHSSVPESQIEWVEDPSIATAEAVVDEAIVAIPESPAETDAEEVAAVEAPAFDIASLSSDLQDLHRRANRVAKVAMQDIKLLRPKDVRQALEHKDVCRRLRSDLDKARKEYDRRFRAILDHPVDYFHHWMVEILAEGDSEALGEYPYPSPVLRH